ncbi:hypothetical protein [Frankia sp. Cppng1_Ct_nod]|uniref:hypothetical protein n=1 Tax=Frankia sp. Cppng1_Ct_nod TaxID=2897162 RepID=UPI00104119FE|nr:hypothetical protein [Frankia sp. Cppng1_Ct_nod]
MSASLKADGRRPLRPPARAGIGSGFNSAAREIGAAFGVAVIGTELNSHGSLIAGMATSYRVLAGVMLVLTVMVVLWWRPAAPPGTGSGRTGPDARRHETTEATP